MMAPFRQVWNNDVYDSSFGITSKIYLDQLTPFGWYLDTLPVPSNPNRDHMVTSFSSKSEIALNLSTNHEYLTFMGYVAAIGLLDVSNSNTAGAVDPTNPVGESFYRAVAQSTTTENSHSRKPMLTAVTMGARRSSTTRQMLSTRRVMPVTAPIPSRSESFWGLGRRSCPLDPAGTCPDSGNYHPGCQFQH